MNNEFKLNFYFNLYKDCAMENRQKFRKTFKEKHGDFPYLPELILMIEKYQIKTYGMTFYDFVYYTPSKKGRKR